MRILIADASSTMRRLIARGLRQAGHSDFELTEASTGTDALRKLRTCSPDLVISDWRLPGLSGLDLLDHIRRSDEPRPLGFITAEHSEANRRAALDGGAAFLIAKPFTTDDLAAALAAMNGHQAHAPDPQPAPPANSAALPPAKTVRDLLRDLFGRVIDVNDTEAWAPTAGDLACIGEYIDEHMKLRAIIALDIPLSVSMGAALSLLPTATAQTMIDDNSPSPLVLDNVRELLSITSNLFAPTDEHPAVHFHTLHRPGSRLPSDVKTILARKNERLDLDVSVSGYGHGRMALIRT